MKTRTLLSQIIRIVITVILIDLVIIAIIAGIGWGAGWQTQEKFKDAVQMAGFLAIGIGFLGIKGNRDEIRIFESQYSKSATRIYDHKKPRKSLLDFVQTNKFMIMMFIAGGICLIIGWLM